MIHRLLILKEGKEGKFEDELTGDELAKIEQEKKKIESLTAEQNKPLLTAFPFIPFLPWKQVEYCSSSWKNQS